MEDESLEEFEKDAKQYLDLIGKKHLNIINNIMLILRTAYHEKKMCSYTEYIESFRILISIKRKLLDKGKINTTDMQALNDISLTFSDSLS